MLKRWLIYRRNKEKSMCRTEEQYKAKDKLRVISRRKKLRVAVLESCFRKSKPPAFAKGPASGLLLTWPALKS